MKEKYTTLMQFAEAQGLWSTVVHLQELSENERLTKLIEVFRRACKACDDTAAERCFELIMRAIEDIASKPFLTTENNQTFRDWGSGMTSKVEESIWTSRAAQTVALWSELPDAQRGSLPVQYAMDDVRSERADVPTLLATRKAMLTEVANRWRSTKDEEEADTLFSFLCRQSGGRFSDYRKLMCDAMRKVTSEHFPAARLARHLTVDETHLSSEIATILGIAWIRNSSAVLQEAFKVLCPLQGGSAAFYQALQSYAAQMKILYLDSISLYGAVQPTYERNTWSEHGVCGKVSFSYPNPSSIVLEIEQFHHLLENPLEWGNAQWELAWLRALRWKKEHQSISLVLVLVIKQGMSGEQVFFRSEQL